MYRYDEFDHAFVRERVAEFKDQVERRLAGKLTEDEFRPLRLRNGLYLQLHAYMLRIAIPYGVLSPAPLRQLAMIGRRWGRGHGHFLPRKFKIPISGPAEDRAAIAFHDIGLKIVRGPNGQNGFRVLVGGGMGRIPYVGQEICAYLEKEELLSYIESVLPLYNLHGRRDAITKRATNTLDNQL